MKKYLFAALGAGLLMTSCQSDEPLAPGNGLEQQVAFTVSLPDAVSTRAGGTNSAAGGVSNNVGANVTFNVALYLIGGSETVPVYTASDVVSSTGNHTSATFEPTLVIGEQYRVVAYAEFEKDVVATGEGVNPETNMGLIAVESGINNEKNDEYFVSTTLTAAPELSATLKRPYGKLRLLADDWDEAERQFNSHIESVKVEYDFGRAKTFDATTGYFGMPDNSYCRVMEASRVDYAEGEFIAAGSSVVEKENVDYKTIFVDYIPAHPVDDTMMPFVLTVTFENGKIYQRSFIQEIPIRRNWLTTLKGDLFTIGSEITLIIEESFDNEKVVPVQ